MFCESLVSARRQVLGEMKSTVGPGLARVCGCSNRVLLTDAWQLPELHHYFSGASGDGSRDVEPRGAVVRGDLHSERVRALYRPGLALFRAL